MILLLLLLVSICWFVKNLNAAPHDTTMVLATSVLKSGTHQVHSFIAPPTSRLSSNERTQSATIQIQGLNSFPLDARAAVQQAVHIWEEQIFSPIEIVVALYWESLPLDVLASSAWYVDVAGNTWYPIALINLQHSRDMQPDFPDITVTVNKNIRWYVGTDGNVPSDQHDLVTTVLHEMCHGLGFTGSLAYQNGLGSWGVPFKGTNYPQAFDRFVVNNQAQYLLSFPTPSQELGLQLTGKPLFFNGKHAIQAAEGKQPLLYTPTIWEKGSSLYHLDEATYRVGDPNSLMTPMLDRGEAVHHPGPITLGILKDIGWVKSSALPVFPTYTPLPQTPPKPTPIPTETPIALPLLTTLMLTTTHPTILGYTTFFTASVQGTYDTIVWDFGDGSPVDSVKGQLTRDHVYQKTGTYTVTATILAVDGRFLASRTITIHIIPPQMHVTVKPNLLGTPTLFQTIISGAYTYMSWDFGDGSPKITQTNQLDIQHLYQATGCFTATMSLFDREGILLNSTMVHATVVPLLIETRVPLLLGQQTMLTATVSPYLSYRAIEWDLGDGTVLTPATGITITHLYMRPQMYWVKATLIDGCVKGDIYRGNFFQYTIPITVVTPVLHMDYRATTIGQETVFTITLEYLAIQPYATLEIDFGDGQNQPLETSLVSETNPIVIQYRYQQTGMYSVTARLKSPIYGGIIATREIGVVIDYGQPFAILVQAESNTLQADGQSTTIITALVTDAWANRLPNQSVDFIATMGQISPARATTDKRGIAYATLQSIPTPGIAAVAAKVGTVSGGVYITFVPVTQSFVYFPLIGNQ